MEGKIRKVLVVSENQCRSMIVLTNASEDVIMKNLELNSWYFSILYDSKKNTKGDQYEMLRAIGYDEYYNVNGDGSILHDFVWHRDEWWGEDLENALLECEVSATKKNVKHLLGAVRDIFEDKSSQNEMLRNACCALFLRIGGEENDEIDR